MPYEINWPKGFERTDPENRRENSKFDVGFRRTESELADEMSRMEVESWWMDDVKGSGNDPGVVVRWAKDGEEFAVACDSFQYKKDNIREIYHWIRETRKRSDRGVETGQSEFAAAKLPEGKGVEKPHEVLGVAKDAPEEVVKASARRLAKDAHPDRESGDEEEFKRIQEAKEQMLD